MSTASRGSRRSHAHSNTISSQPQSNPRSHPSRPGTSQGGAIPQPPYGQSLTPSNDSTFEACAATASFFLYAQRNIILCLHHDTLAIERRFEKHKEDVLWISTDNVSDRGNGRLIVSYDTSQTTIVWDVMTGDEVARFASYEEIRVAAWMKNSNIAFGNSQGNVILFEPSTSEHISARTIFDPITALAPSADCRTFALGYMNGSILVANLQPSFTILHTLSTNRAPSPLSRLAWHGSSSKQKSDMLAAQTADGDLRVWSIPKVQGTDQPSIIRVLSRTENDRISGLCWFGWSKMGRIVQYSDGLTFVWDVRTKRVTYESVPTVDGLVGITHYGPTATLFTLGRNHTVQQYDLNPNSRPMLVQNVQHVPANLPPSPPISDGQQDKNARYATAGPAPSQRRQEPNSNLPLYLDIEDSGAEEGVIRSPLARLAKQEDSDFSEEEIESRDRLGALSPVSSRASTTSRSSRGANHRKQPPQRPASRDENRQRPMSPGMVSQYSAQSGSAATTFSMGSVSAKSGYQQRAMRESVSTRSLLSTSTSARSNNSTSGLRQEVLRSPEETKNTMLMDLFPYTKARLSEVVFRPPQYDQSRCTPDDLRNQMLEVVFGWSDDIEALIRDELARHRPGSASAVLLSKWLGDLGADLAASMIGSESMTSSDWMLLALSSMGQDSQKKVGEAFVQRLLEKEDIHPAVSILLGLGEYMDAIEVYVSRKYFMEAVLLTCLMFPTDWQRQSHLVRKWGEVVVAKGQAELAVRCFSCTGMVSSEPWFSPRAQDEVFALQQRIMQPDTPNSLGASPTSSRGARLLPNQVGLKLVTSFNKIGAPEPTTAVDEKTPMVHGVTPIDAPFSPAGRAGRRQEPVSAMSTRTATPGGYSRRRMPSSSRGGSTKTHDTLTPQIESARSEHPQTAVKMTRSELSQASSRARSISASQVSSSYLSTGSFQGPGQERHGLPSPANNVFDRLRAQSRSRGAQHERKPEGLVLYMDDVMIDPSLPSSVPTGASASEYTHITAGSPSVARSLNRGMPNMPAQQSALMSSKIRSIDEYISGLSEANFPQTTSQSRNDNHSRNSNRPASRTTERAPSESRGRGSSTTKYIRPAKRSPSSPVSMSPDDPALQLANHTFDDERYYGVASPSVESAASVRRASRREASKDPGGRSARSRPTSKDRTRSRSRATRNIRRDREETTDVDGRGRSTMRGDTSAARSPSSPRPMSPSGSTVSRSKVGERVRERSMSRRPRSPSNSRRPMSPENSVGGSRMSSKPPMPRLQTNMSENNVLARTKKEIAAQELEARRMSLVRRPSAPPVIHPDEIVPKSAIDAFTDPSQLFAIASEMELIRGHTADPHALRKLASYQMGTSTRSVPMGLPATPRAMRHPKDMVIGNEVPAVPEIPANFGAPNMPYQDQDTLTLLPSSTFQPTSGPHSRSASAPPEKFFGHQRRPSKGHSRQNSRDDSRDNITVVSPGPNGGVSFSRNIDETIRESQVIVIPEQIENLFQEPPPMLPELQHLAGPPIPPPPPPPPMGRPQGHSPSHSEGMINVVVDDLNHRVSPPSATPVPSDFGRTDTPELSSTPAHGHRHGRNSISESVNSRFRGISSRIRDRSASRSRPTISPPVQQYTGSSAPYESVPQRQAGSSAPYESVPQRQAGSSAPYESISQRRPSVPNIPSGKSRTPMPYETMASLATNPSDEGQALLLPSTTFGGYRNPKEIARQMREREEQMTMGEGIDRLQGASTAPPRASMAPYQSYRGPREIRANMPPSHFQAGADHPGQI